MVRQTSDFASCHMQSLERAYAERRMAEKDADAELVRLAQGGGERAIKAHRGK